MLGCRRTARPARTFSSLAEDVKCNPTVFGKLLRGEVQPGEAGVYHDDDAYFAFANIKSYAPLAGLVIPKRRLHQDPDALSAAELDTVRGMRRVALEVCAREQPEAYAAGDYWLRFHRRPFHSVDHLHMHVLAPASKASAWTSFVFLAGSPWAHDAGDVISRLEREALDEKT